ncbi:spermatogenesis-associated protein 3 isoform X3 [Eptesicus fuscus]|uniref:spermatogenesis-associated protein 3 isoform X3 n=1 Tax=Eptesicus fuscus TaxID=29078 RepID=UPI0024048D1B|nr:spermatogenesis-associated protein 3 isoform X3 [Eptesicus fuscus]
MKKGKKKKPESKRRGSNSRHCSSESTSQQPSLGSSPKQPSVRSTPHQSSLGSTPQQNSLSCTPQQQRSSEFTPQQPCPESTPQQPISGSIPQQQPQSSEFTPQQPCPESTALQPISGSTPQQPASGSTPRQPSLGSIAQRPVIRALPAPQTSQSARGLLTQNTGTKTSHGSKKAGPPTRASPRPFCSCTTCPGSSACWRRLGLCHSRIFDVLLPRAWLTVSGRGFPNLLTFYRGPARKHTSHRNSRAPGSRDCSCGSGGPSNCLLRH